MKKHISTSNWNVQQPNAGRNTQHLLYSQELDFDITWDILHLILYEFLVSVQRVKNRQ